MSSHSNAQKQSRSFLLRQAATPLSSEASFIARLRDVDEMLVGMYKRLSDKSKEIARTGIEQRMAACERLDIPFDFSIAREIIDDARNGLAVYKEV